jgi:hypothetical protein
MFLKSIKRAFDLGKVRVDVPGERLIIYACGFAKVKAFFLTKGERQRLAKAVKAKCSMCRICGVTLPGESIQGSGWHRRCAGCYPKDSLPTNLDDATEISITVGSKRFRVFPHLANDGLLAMRILTNTASYVLMPDGAIRMRPDDFVMPAGFPVQAADAIERNFILTGQQADDAKKIFEAYEGNDFEVIEGKG